MRIRTTAPQELDEVMAIYAQARQFMAAHGNPNQWGPTNWPPRSLVEADIAAGKSHVCVTDDERIAAVFYYDFGDHVDPCYDIIEEGSWESDTPYGVVHRIASAGIVRGAGTACITWALDRSTHLRIDTHGDNHVLQGLLAKLGFSQRGIIHVQEDDAPRLAYEQTLPHRPLATVLVDDTPANGLCSEWGLSMHLRLDHLQLLCDFGQSDALVRNAMALGIDLADVDHAVLSHAHYDHANGMEAFLACNDHAPVHLSEACSENCWSTKGGSVEPHYIGIVPGALERQRPRLSLEPVTRPTTIAPGVHLVPHGTKGLEALGGRAGMLLRIGGTWLPDGFAHELSLVLELGAGVEGYPELAVLSSCSHAGLAAIIREVSEAFPAARIASFVGGLHLMRSSEAEIQAAAQALRAAGIKRIFTGHCTGTRALEQLSAELPGRICTLRPGMRFLL